MIVFAEPSFGVRVMMTEQLDVTSSFQEATVTSPILSSSPETVTEGPAITFTEFRDTVIVGALVSWVGVGGFGLSGVTGVGGVGSTGSSPLQETRTESIRNQARSRVGKELCML